MVIPEGRRSVVAMRRDVPLGVIRDTVSAPLLVVYTLPDESIVMPIGRLPVVPRILETPVAVIFETFFEFQLAVYRLPEPSIVIACGHYLMAVPTEATFWLGLLAIALGTGLLKPNISAMVGMLIQEHAFDALDAPIQRVCSLDAPAIYSPALESLQLPTVARIIEKVLHIR